jgi:hypothetical protein
MKLKVKYFGVLSALPNTRTDFSSSTDIRLANLMTFTAELTSKVTDIACICVQFKIYNTINLNEVCHW